MSIHVCKCEHKGRTEYHLRYPGMTENEAQNLADKINAGALSHPAPAAPAQTVKASKPWGYAVDHYGWGLVSKKVYEDFLAANGPARTVKLYTSPHPSAPTAMSEQEVIAAWDALRPIHGGEPCKLSHLAFARAIEQRHGITAPAPAAGEKGNGNAG